MTVLFPFVCTNTRQLWKKAVSKASTVPSWSVRFTSFYHAHKQICKNSSDSEEVFTSTLSSLIVTATRLNRPFPLSSTCKYLPNLICLKYLCNLRDNSLKNNLRLPNRSSATESISLLHHLSTTPTLPQEGDGIGDRYRTKRGEPLEAQVAAAVAAAAAAAFRVVVYIWFFVWRNGCLASGARRGVSGGRNHGRSQRAAQSRSGWRMTSVCTTSPPGECL